MSSDKVLKQKELISAVLMNDVTLQSVDEALREKRKRALGLIAAWCEKALQVQIVPSLRSDKG